MSTIVAGREPSLVAAARLNRRAPTSTSFDVKFTLDSYTFCFMRRPACILCCGSVRLKLTTSLLQSVSNFSDDI